jgi:hypothetical protein
MVQITCLQGRASTQDMFRLALVSSISSEPTQPHVTLFQTCHIFSIVISFLDSRLQSCGTDSSIIL